MARLNDCGAALLYKINKAPGEEDRKKNSAEKFVDIIEDLDGCQKYDRFFSVLRARGTINDTSVRNGIQRKGKIRGRKKKNEINSSNACAS